MIVRDFLIWMETAPAERRAEATHALCRAYLYADVDEETRNAMEAALTLLLDDPSADVRLALADTLGSSDHAPRHVIVTLATDQADIAELVLSRSPLFIDAELVDIAAAVTGRLQSAIARRPVVSHAVAASISEVGDRDACLALLDNPGATVARISFRRIAERFAEDFAVRDALLARKDLPADVHQRIIRAVGDQLGNLIVQKAWVPENRAKAVIRDACDRATVAIAAETETQELAALVEHLRVTEQLTTALLLRAVCAGNVAFFEAALAALSGAPLRRISSLVRAGRIPGLRAAYAKAGLPPLAFDAFAAALETWRRAAGEGGPKDKYRFTMQMVDAVIARYTNITDGEVNELTAMLRRFAADQAREAARDFAKAAVAAEAA